MSINVTVSGNPISIKRGKMVTCDPNHAKKEFDKRRLMRLEQVRQQSKDIAEDVRNKVRREKKKQMNQIEEEGKEKLRNWQNRKLLEVQTQYKEALRELGTGHKEAVELEGEDDVLVEQKDYNKEMANYRSQVAATHLQMEKEKKHLKKSIPIQQKNIVRDIEKSRASLVSNMKNKKTKVNETNNLKQKRKRASADINITIPELDTDSEDDKDEQRKDDASFDEELKSLSECTEDSEEPREPLDVDKNLDSKGFCQETLQDVSSGISPEGISPYAKNLETRKHFPDYFRETGRTLPKQPPIDTRISDRIRRRDVMASHPDYCETIAETHPTPFVESNTKIRDAIDARYLRKSPDSGRCCTCGKGQTSCSCTCGKYFNDRRYIEDDIPTKPPVKLKETDSHPSKVTLQSNDSQKMQYYDHPNRFSQEKLVPGKSRVEKITTDSLEVIPNITSETEWKEKVRQRDKDARLRGQKALEKERIQKDYEDMMKKLPLLQKKERICQITRDKPEYHMDEERLKERERQRQNKLDNAYSKLFPSFKPAIVTLPKSRKPEKEVRTLPDDEPVQSLNVGKWDVDHEQKMFTAEEVREIVRAFTEQQKPKDRQAKLKELLKSLKLQKEQLLAEIKSLPKDDSINQLINDLNSFSDSDERIKTSRRDKSERKRQREENEKEMSGDSTTESSSSQTRSARNNKKSKGRPHPESSKVPSPRKKAKIKARKKVLILQNTSTQTTPKASCVPEDKPRIETEHPTCSKRHVPCDCNKENEKSTEEVCQIFIKLNDREGPEVVVKAKEKEDKVSGDQKIKQVSPGARKIKSKSVAVGTDEVEAKPLTEQPDVMKVSSKATRVGPSGESKKSGSKKSKSESRTEKSEGRKSTVSQLDGSEKKSKSWKDHLSKNSISTSSTSYYSPPDFKPDDLHLFSSVSDVTKQSYYNLRKKPQQGNLHEFSASVSLSHSQSSSGRKTIDPSLILYIKKLLSKSRESIDNLTVSSSSVQTPSQSIVEMDSNNPMAQLHNVIKYFNLKTEEIARELSYSSDHATPHYNTSASSSEASHQEGERSKGAKSVSSGNKISLNSVKPKDSFMLQYADITDCCSKRIAALADMIQQLREEKIQMLNNGPGAEEKSRNITAMGSDRDHSTAYLDLPGSKESSKHSSLNSLDDDELHKKLMEIDLGLAKKLRKFSPVREEKITEDEDAEMAENKEDVDQSGNIDRELWNRLKQLMRQDIEGPHGSSITTESDKEKNVTFVPFLTDIPKLPKLEIKTDTDINNSSHRHPPPSKGLTVAKKFNGNISLVPHELSTILEADSQLSTKLDSNQVSPRVSQASSPRKPLQLLVKRKDDEESGISYSASSKSGADVPDVVTKVSIVSKKSPKKRDHEEKSKKSSNSKSSSPLNFSYDISSKSIILDGSGSKSTTISSKKSVLMTSSSSDDLETIETMLKSIGMEWAIPTLHKTQEALALTSSSSSLDFTAQKSTAKGDDAGGSEVSLKEYLRRQVLSKISSSTLKSDASPASMLSEFSELSSIQVSSKERKSNQRTSTPVTASKSSKSRGSEKMVAFSGDSDISSVREEPRIHSDKYSFCSLSEYSVSKND